MLSLWFSIICAYLQYTFRSQNITKAISNHNSDKSNDEIQFYELEWIKNIWFPNKSEGAYILVQRIAFGRQVFIIIHLMSKGNSASENSNNQRITYITSKIVQIRVQTKILTCSRFSVFIFTTGSLGQEERIGEDSTRIIL